MLSSLMPAPTTAFRGPTLMGLTRRSRSWSTLCGSTLIVEYPTLSSIASLTTTFVWCGS